MSINKRPSAVFLQDLIDELTPDRHFNSTRCRDIRSAVNTLARALDRSASRIPADPVQLRYLLDRDPPALSNLSRKRWQNIRADMIALIKTHQNPSPRRVGLNDEWSALKAQLTTKRLRTALCGFVTYCSNNGILAIEVSDETAKDYHRYLLEETLRAHPNRCHRDTCIFWNHASSLVPDWPTIKLTIPSYKKPRQSLAPEQQPESLRTEVDAYLNWLAGKTFDREPPIRIYKPTTLRLVRQHLTILISAATDRNDPTDCPITLAELIQEERLRRIAQYFQQHFASKPSAYLENLLSTLFRLAKNWLHANEEALIPVRGYRRRMGKTQNGLSKKNRGMLAELQHPDMRQRLFDLPDKLDQAARKLKSPYRQAVMRQIAMAIDVLLHAPMRSGNLVALCIEEHIRNLSGDGEIQILLEADEVKNNQALMYPISGRLAKRLRHYIKEDQPVLGGNNCTWLFPGQDPTRHKNQRTLAQQLDKLIRRHLGMKITPHQFRHIAAAIMLDAHPGAYPLVQRMLGHSSMKTTTNSYCGMEMGSALKTYDAILNQNNKAGEDRDTP